VPKPFKGVINLDIRDSTPDWEPFMPPRARDGAPNILYIVWDDTGLAAWDTFGGLIETLNMSRLAGMGPMFTNWHTTALCSPTRSCLLTGRNAHTNSMAHGTLRLFLGDRAVGEGRIRTQPGAFGLGEGLTVGRDAGDAVSREYQAPFAFAGGNLEQVTVSIRGEHYVDMKREAMALARE
jgi:hypothetical protein